MKTTIKGTMCQRFFQVLLILLIGGIGANLFTSCSSDDNDSNGNNGGGGNTVSGSCEGIVFGVSWCTQPTDGYDFPEDIFKEKCEEGGGKLVSNKSCSKNYDLRCVRPKDPYVDAFFYGVGERNDCAFYGWNNPNDGGNDFSSLCDSGGGDFTENSLIYICDDTICNSPTQEYTGNGILKMMFELENTVCSIGEDCECDNYNNCTFYIDAGSVTNGIVTLNMPTNLLSKFMSRGSGSVSETVSEFYLFTDTNERLQIGAFKMNIEQGTMKYEGVGYMYSTESKKGTRERNNENDCEGSMIEDMNFKVGWNKVYFKMETVSTFSDTHTCKQTSFVSSCNILTEEIKWVILLK